MTENSWATKNRLEALVDGTIAIAITLLVLYIKVPIITVAQAKTGLLAELSNLEPDFFAFFLSFALLAVFWMAHHRQFQVIERVDETFLWLNILMLSFIVLVPFSTSLREEYLTSRVATVFFETNLFLIGLSLLLCWWYASKDHRLVSADLTLDQIRYGLKREMVLPAVSLIAIGLAFFTPQYSTVAYLLIPVIRAIIRRK